MAYLKENLNGCGKIPEKDWRAEREKLLAERYTMVDEYYKLNDDLKNVEALRRGEFNARHYAGAGNHEGAGGGAISVWVGARAPAHTSIVKRKTRLCCA